MFEKATKMKLRWTERGRIGVEDLWDLAPEDLDQIFKNLSRQTKAAQEESLLVTRSDEDTVLALQIEIVKRIVAVKLAEVEAAEATAANKQRKQKLLTVLEHRQDAELEDLSAEELQAMIDSIG